MKNYRGVCENDVILNLVRNLILNTAFLETLKLIFILSLSDNNIVVLSQLLFFQGNSLPDWEFPSSRTALNS